MDVVAGGQERLNDIQIGRRYERGSCVLLGFYLRLTMEQS